MTEAITWKSERLESLDGMRGVAALMVVVHHFTARWSQPVHHETLYPHGNFADALPFLVQFGDLGVRLFFMISGFVIFMTLERCAGLVDFAIRRLARLWPAMIVAATLSTIVVNGSDLADRFPDIVTRRLSIVDYLSSIFFVRPDLVSGLFNLEQDAKWVEGAYWTLFVEVRFYALIAILWFALGGKRLLFAWLAVQAISSTMLLTHAVGLKTPLDTMITNLLFMPKELAWFSLGICGLLRWRGAWSPEAKILFGLSLASALLYEAQRSTGGLLGNVVGALCIIGVFWLFVRRSAIVSVFRWRPLVAVGLASYPLYLFHEQVGMLLLGVFSDLGVSPNMGLALTFTVVLAIAFAIHGWIEDPGRRLIRAAGRGMVRILARS